MARATPAGGPDHGVCGGAVLLLALLAGTNAGARAQEGEGDRAHKSAARELFTEGVGLADDERWTEAEDRFRRALAFKASPVIAFNLASVLAKQAELTEASELLHGVLRDPEAPASVRDPAAALLAEIEPRVCKLTIEVEGGRPGDTVTLDGRELRAAELGVALPVDPGVHSIVALRGEERIVSDSVTVVEGGSERILLDLPRAEDDATPAPNLAPPPPASEPYTSEPEFEYSEERSGGSGWLVWTAVGVGAVAVVVVAVVLATSAKQKTEEPFEGDFDPPSLRVVVAP